MMVKVQSALRLYEKHRHTDTDSNYNDIIDIENLSHMETVPVSKEKDEKTTNSLYRLCAFRDE
jgi:hypothetical protein